MASIPLRFVPLDVDDLVTLRIWEASSASGPFSVIDTVTEIGAYPSYISEYTSDNALNAADWFAISWIDSGGAETPLSTPLKGGESTLVGVVMQRVRERNHSLDQHIVQQETEVVIQTWFGEAVDPYDPALAASYRILNGLTYMVMARSLMANLVSTTLVEQATIGLVSFKGTNPKATMDAIQQLINLAEKDLGIGGSHVLDMERICQAYGGQDWRVLRQLLFNDQEFAFIPWKPWPIERAGSRR